MKSTDLSMLAYTFRLCESVERRRSRLSMLSATDILILFQISIYNLRYITFAIQQRLYNI
jgi:hypothetical protein